jgi:Raf kinase inhibitor-like YbhB/YbcL family protein
VNGNDPLAGPAPVPAFTLTSTDLSDGQPLALAQRSGAFGVPDGEDRSPQLSWSGAPEATQGYAVTVYDPDAPTGSGFWHWAVMNIPASVTELPAGAGEDDGPGLPSGAIQLPNDARLARYTGGAPLAGNGPHRYHVTVHALDVADVGIPADSTPAFLGFAMSGHVLARTTLVAPTENPG